MQSEDTYYEIYPLSQLHFGKVEDLLTPDAQNKHIFD